MRIARIELTQGPHAGARSYARISDDGSIYHPISDPFASETRYQYEVLDEKIAASEALLLAPCEPRLVLGMAHNTGPADRMLPPQAFLKSPHSVVGPGEAITLEPGQDSVDGEAELAIVIGSRARNLTAQNALTAVFGYTCANDVTDRADQAADSLWTPAKSRDTFTPLGPWIDTDLPTDHVTVVLGDDRGDGPAVSTAALARGVVEILVYLTSVLTLHPGDVVLTGAPGPSRRLVAGDTSRVTVDGIGELVNPVAHVLDNRAELAHNAELVTR